MALVADELGLEARLSGKRSSGLGAPVGDGGPGAVALLIHQLHESRLVHRSALLGGDLGGQLKRKPVGVVQPEGVLGRHLSLGLEHLVEQLGAGLERPRKPLLLGPQQRRHGGLTGDQLRVDVAEQLDNARVQPRQKLALDADPAGLQHRPADDASKHVPAPFVARLDAVGGKEAHRPAVVGEHPQSLGLERRIAVARAAPALNGGDHVAKTVGVVHAVDALGEHAWFARPHSRCRCWAAEAARAPRRRACCTA